MLLTRLARHVSARLFAQRSSHKIRDICAPLEDIHELPGMVHQNGQRDNPNRLRVLKYARYVLHAALIVSYIPVRLTSLG